jgi:hypothetical protein
LASGALLRSDDPPHCGQSAAKANRVAKDNRR